MESRPSEGEEWTSSLTQQQRDDIAAYLARSEGDLFISNRFQAAIPLTLLASILVKRGLDAFCRCPPIQAGR